MSEKVAAFLGRVRIAPWVPVNEELPEEEGDYMVTVRFPFPGLDEQPFVKPAYFKDGKWHEQDPNQFKTWEVEHVVAWQPKPTPYTPAKEENKP